MKAISLYLSILVAPILCAAAERPNILWITSEDNSAYYLGCYGNEQAHTPHIDRLAAEGNRYLRAYSNAPVCAVARSTLITGVYAVTQGTQHMRSRYPLPDPIRPYVGYLREAGYYCTNNSKTDYNLKGNDASYWDESSQTAHYKNRTDGQPFFAIFNYTTSHESSVFPDRLSRNREQGNMPRRNRVDPSEIQVPPLYPDVPEVRQDLADYYDAVTEMDQKVGETLAELERAGLAEDTIVFYFSDHGGILPRSKRYIYNSGTHVPLIVHFPEKWRHLAPAEPGRVVEDPVGFIDLTPTLLSLAGVSKPEYMQGRILFGEDREAPQDAYVFLFGDRFDETYKLNRGLTDGRFRYIRNFLPIQTGALRNAYPYNMDSWRAYRKAGREGRLTPEQARLWEDRQSVEELYDTDADPWELNNLADDPRYRVRLVRMRQALWQRMIETRDLGMIPEPMWESLSSGDSIYHYARSDRYDHEDILALAFETGQGDPANCPVFRDAILSSDPVRRYWGLMGLAVLQIEGEKVSESDLALNHLERPVNRILAGWILARKGVGSGVDLIVKEVRENANDPTLVFGLNVLRYLNATDRLPDEWYAKLASERDSYRYASRLGETIPAEH